MLKRKISEHTREISMVVDELFKMLVDALIVIISGA
jgi:hypothetical protein